MQHPIPVTLSETDRASLQTFIHAVKPTRALLRVHMPCSSRIRGMVIEWQEKVKRLRKWREARHIERIKKEQEDGKQMLDWVPSFSSSLDISASLLFLPLFRFIL